MTTERLQHSSVHASFETQRQYAFTPARVFNAFKDPKVRALWNSPSEGVTIRTQAADFRVGGLNIEICVADGQDIAHVETRYLEIVENTRLMFSEAISEPDRFLGASLVTVGFIPVADGTRLTLTVQTSAVDGSELEKGVVEGWESALDRLAAAIGAH